MKLSVNRDACRGAGICVGIAPELFDIADDGAVVGLVVDVPESDLEAAREAVQSCPMRALSLVEG